MAIINRQDTLSCIHPGSAFNTALKAQLYSPAVAGWKLIPVFTNSNFAVSSGDVQLNQTQSGLNYLIYNWGGGNNTTDTGCQYQLRLMAIEGGDVVDTLGSRIDELRDATLGMTFSNDPGYLSEAAYTSFAAQLSACEHALNSPDYNLNDYRELLNQLNTAYVSLTNAVNLPRASLVDSVFLYSITVQRDQKSIAWQGMNTTLKAATFVDNNPGYSWKLNALNDGSFSICDADESYYIESASSGTPPVLMSNSGIQTKGGWKFQLIDKGPWFIIVNGSNQINVSNAGTGYTLYNWGGGTNTTDTGCRFTLSLRSTKVISSTNEISSTTSLDNLQIVNRRIYNPELFPGLRAYTLTGIAVSVNQPLPTGILLVTFNGTTKKLSIL